uniref:Uncharacterized protein n=1 Tax=Arundo donax TaxID=35708 RepID=A0A0A8ZD34_ARUDO
MTQLVGYHLAQHLTLSVTTEHQANNQTFRYCVSYGW